MVWILENVAQKLDLKTEILLIIPSTHVLQFHTPPLPVYGLAELSPPPSRGLHHSCFPLHLESRSWMLLTVMKMMHKAGLKNIAYLLKAKLFSLSVLIGGSQF